MELDTKKPWQSKTMVLNAVAGIIAAVALFYPPADIVRVFLNDHAAEVGMVWGILNIILRASTKDKISLVD